MKVVNSKELIGVYYRRDNKLALAEASELEEGLFYFNRIFVPKEWRGEGLGDKILRKLLITIRDRNLKLVCEVSSYGEISDEDLKEWYICNGFREEGELLIYK